MTRYSREDLTYRDCAGVVLVNADGRIFAGQRIDHDQGAWQMPQGGIDPGETPEQAALREMTEETGIPPNLVSVEAELSDWVFYDLPDDLLGRIWKGKYRGQRQKWLLCRFQGQDSDVNIATDHPEFSAWTWMTPDELIRQIVPFKRDVYASVLAEFEGKI